eukprot:gb/GFBE01039340.1/.p1 GENE.gb/GFBE01039340.1/~~gb/GFBE01039340.1/.p1  ORF type:complete len:117 (+),score=33.13 gb/GFBE01039340.1/:1-351(+)
MAEGAEGQAPSAFPSQYDESGMTSFDRVEAELRGQHLKLICEMSNGDTAEVVCNVGHDVAYAKGQLAKIKEIDYDRLSFYLDGKLMFDPLSFNDFPAIMAIGGDVIEVRVAVQVAE